MPFNAEPPASVLAAVRPAAVISGDEQVVCPVGTGHPRSRTPLSLPCVIGAHGAEPVLEPAMMAGSAQHARTAPPSCGQQPQNANKRSGTLLTAQAADCATAAS